MHKSVASFSPGALRTHDHRAWLRQGLEHDRLAPRLPAPRPNRSPRPSTPSKATARAIRPPSRRRAPWPRLNGPAGPPAEVAGRVRPDAAPLRMAAAERHPRHHLRQRQGRVLPVPEHLADRAEIDGVLRQAARTGEGRRRARHRLRRGRLHPPQLRHQPGQHREGPGPHGTLRPHPEIPARIKIVAGNRHSRRASQARLSVSTAPMERSATLPLPHYRRVVV